MITSRSTSCVSRPLCCSSGNVILMMSGLYFPVIVGEVANFAAYAFAPAILVTPLGALRIIIR